MRGWAGSAYIKDMRSLSLICPFTFAPFAALLWVATSSLACQPGSHDLPSSAGAASSVSLAVDADYLFAVNEGSVLRYDRETGAVDALEAPEQYGYGINYVGLNATRVFFATEGGGLSSLPREGGAVRVESESAPDGCFGKCAALDDETLYMSAGNASEDAALVVLDLATGSSTTREAPWGLSLAINEETVFGMSCYELWSIPREGGEVSSLLQTEVWGEDREPDCAGSLVVDGSSLYYSGVDGISRMAHDWADREVIAAAEQADIGAPFAVREGQLYAAFDGAIHHIFEDQDEVLVEVEDVAGLAVDGDTLYWSVRSTSGDLEFFELELD